MPNQKGSATAHAVSIGTNAKRGMTLSVKDKDGTELALTSATTAEKIPAVSGTLAAGTTPGWNITAAGGGANGYIGGNDGSGSANGFTDKAITAAGEVVYEGTEKEEVDVNMTYNFATALTQAAATYSDIITYTVNANV